MTRSGRPGSRRLQPASPILPVPCPLSKETRWRTERTGGFTTPSRRALARSLDTGSGGRGQAGVVVGTVVAAADRLDEDLSALAAILRLGLAFAALRAAAEQLGAELVLPALCVAGAGPGGSLRREEAEGGDRRERQEEDRADQEQAAGVVPSHREPPMESPHHATPAPASPSTHAARSRSASGEEPAAGGVTDQLGGVVDAELLHQPAAVVVGGLGADPEVAGDLLGRAAVDHQVEDLALPRREAAIGTLDRRRLPALFGEHPRRLGTEVALAGVEGAHRGEELAHRAVLDQVAGGAGAHDRQDVLLLLVDREGELADLRQLLVDAAYRLEARQARHGEVDHRHLRPRGARLLDRLQAVRRLGHHLALAALDEQAHQPLAYQGVIVGDQDPHP